MVSLSLSLSPSLSLSIFLTQQDIWAAYNATVEARHIATTQNTPVMIEAMTYRVGHHSTSDDSTRFDISSLAFSISLIPQK